MRRNHYLGRFIWPGIAVHSGVNPRYTEGLDSSGEVLFQELAEWCQEEAKWSQGNSRAAWNFTRLSPGDDNFLDRRNMHVYFLLLQNLILKGLFFQYSFTCRVMAWPYYASDQHLRPAATGTLVWSGLTEATAVRTQPRKESSNYMREGTDLASVRGQGKHDKNKKAVELQLSCNQENQTPSVCMTLLWWNVKLF